MAATASPPPLSSGVFPPEWHLTYDPARTVYVANIAKDVTDKTLKDFFTFAGAVSKLQITRQPNSTTETAYAFVEFVTPGPAHTAASVLTNTNLMGKVINVLPATTPGVPPLPGTAPAATATAITGSPPSASAALVGINGAPGSTPMTMPGGLPPGGFLGAPGGMGMGMPMGMGMGGPAAGGMIPPQYMMPPGGMPPGSVGGFPDPNSGHPGGMYHHGPPQRQMPQVYGTNMQTPEEVARTVYVGNINGQQVTAQQLMNFFSSCGPINFCRMAGDDNHPSRFAFIEFATLEAAANAMAINGVQLADKPLRVNKSKNPIVRPVPRETENAEREKRERRLRAVISSIHRRIGYGVTDAHGSSSFSDDRRRSRSGSRSRSPSSRKEHSRRDRSRDRDRDRDSRRDRDRDRERDEHQGRARDRERSRDRHEPSSTDRVEARAHEIEPRSPRSSDRKRPRDMVGVDEHQEAEAPTKREKIEDSDTPSSTTKQ